MNGFNSFYRKHHRPAGFPMNLSNVRVVHQRQCLPLCLEGGEGAALLDPRRHLIERRNAERHEVRHSQPALFGLELSWAFVLRANRGC